MNKMDIILSSIDERTNFNSIMESLNELNIEYEIINKDKKLKYNVEESIVEQSKTLLSNSEISSRETTTIKLPNSMSKSITPKRLFISTELFKTNNNEELIA